MNLLCSAVDNERRAFEEHAAEWRQRGHIVKYMPFEYMARYLRWDPSSQIALVDAIVCWANGNMLHFDRFEMEPISPILRALRLARYLCDLPEGCAMRDGRKWKRLPFLIFAGALFDRPETWDFPDNIVTLNSYCDWYPQFALNQIQQHVEDYHRRVLKEYEQLGILIRFDRGRCQIGPALRPKLPDTEGAYYIGGADRRDNRRWMTIRRDREGRNRDLGKHPMNTVVFNQ